MARPRFTSLGTSRPNPRRWLRRLSFVALGVVALGLLFNLISSEGVPVGIGALIGLGIMGFQLRTSDEPVRRDHGPAMYAFDASTARFATRDGEHRVERSEVVSVELDPTDALVLERRDGSTVRLVASERRSLARVAGDLGHGHAIVRLVRGGSAVDRLDRAFALAAFGGFVALALVTLSLCAINISDRVGGTVDPAMIAGALGALVVCAGAALAFRGTDVRVGSDGVSYSVLTRRRFVPHARIEDVKQGDRGVWLTLAGGREVLLPAKGIARARLAEYIDEARTAARASTGESLGALLDRGARSVDEWKRAAAAVAVNPGGYRARSVEPAQLKRIVEDGGAPPERRVAAALALRSATGKRRRILVAAQTSADDALRAALEAAADGEVAEEHLAQATLRFHRRE
ncbi:MAG: hypothetical protein U0414_30425 [Polyangiaceae bacterium]